MSWVVRIGLAMALTALISGAPAHAAKLQVDTAVDEFGAGGTTACALREAVQAARINSAFGGCAKGSQAKRDTIELTTDVALSIAGDTGANADGDLDLDKGGKLTILGDKDYDLDPVDISAGPGFNDRLIDIAGGSVKIQGVEISDGSGVKAGGGILARKGARVAVVDADLHDNEASNLGGAIACTGCKSMRVLGAFHIRDNSVSTTSGSISGGAIYSDAPLTVAATPKLLDFELPDISGNSALGVSFPVGAGGAIFANDTLVVRGVYLGQNSAGDVGGAIAVGGRQVAIEKSTIEDNSASAAGGIFVGEDAEVTIVRTAILANEVQSESEGRSAFGGGVVTESDTLVRDSVVADNTVALGSSGAQGGGGLFAQSPPAPGSIDLSLVRTSITRNTVEALEPGGGILARGARVKLANSTLADNEAMGAGGGLFVDNGSTPLPGTEIKAEFSTIKGNSSPLGSGTYIAGDARFRATIIDQPGDGCAGDTAATGGYNVEENSDPECGITDPTDSHFPDFLTALANNGGPRTGHEVDATGGGVPALTHAFTNNASSALDQVPPSACKIDGQKLRVDQRGAPRPAEDGCDSGAIERSRCLTGFVAGQDSYVGTGGPDEAISVEKALTLGGDDYISTGSGDSNICAGGGDDTIRPTGDNYLAGEAGVDLLDLSGQAATVIDLAAGTAVGADGDEDVISGIENVEGSNGADEIAGDSEDNLLVGGLGADILSGRGGIDILNARDGQADLEIDCGPGNNSKEKAKIDKGLDPKPKSC